MKARILVIDDEAEVRRSVGMILRYDDYEVIEASSGPEGIALAEKEVAGPGLPGHQDAGDGRPRGAAEAAGRER